MNNLWILPFKYSEIVHDPYGIRTILASHFILEYLGYEDLASSEPSNPQFEPALAWLDHLRKVYTEPQAKNKEGTFDISL